MLLCCLRDGENNLPSTPFKIYTEFNKKFACTKETEARNLCNERLGVLCWGLSLNCFCKSFVMKPTGLFKRDGRVPKSFFFEKPNKTMSFFRSAFQSALWKHAEAFLLCVMQAFQVQKFLGTLLRKSFAHKSFIQRANNASWLISYFDVPTAIGFTAFLRFLTDMRCCENSKCVSKNGNLEQLWISV